MCYKRADMSADYVVFKLIVVGNSSVGKTSLVRQYVDGHNRGWTPTATIGVDFYIRWLQLDGYNVKLQIWDTAGQEKYRGVPGIFYRSANIVFIVYDVSQPASLEAVNFWLEEIHNFTNNDNVVVLVANKVDIDDERAVATAQGRQLAEQHGLLYFETSTLLSGRELEHVIKAAVKQRLDNCYSNHPYNNNNNNNNNNNSGQNSNKVQLSSEGNSTGYYCCGYRDSRQ